MPTVPYEQRLRSSAARQGLKLVKSPCRTVEAVEYGTYMLCDRESNFVVASGLPNGYGLHLEDIERALADR
jgi:hypothetical protein